jgi:hypothetical protein
MLRALGSPPLALGFPPLALGFPPLALAALLAFSGCATVEAWERGRLAKPHMALEPDPSERLLREHMYLAREAAAGGEAGRGGGCGCY